MDGHRDTSFRPHAHADLILIVLFLTLIAIPGGGLLAGMNRARVSEAEMRTLAEFPALSWQTSELASWPDRFQTYFNDRFAFRNTLLRVHAAVLWHVFHTSASDTVIAGRGDWLFYADDGGLEDYVQTEPFTDEELTRWERTLERMDNWLASRGTRFLFVLAPDKQMIYPEWMPASLRRRHEHYRADQLLAYMRAHSTVPILDLRPGLIAAKPQELLYHRYDTHWNDRGALIAYQQIAERLQEWFPAIEPLQREDFVTSPDVPSGDRTTMLNLTDTGKEAMPGLVPRRGWTAKTIEPTRPDPYGEDGTVITELPTPRTGIRAVMFRDSFGSRLIPFLSEHFDRSVYQWQKDFDTGLVRAEQPDVVIVEMVARHLVTFIPTPELVPDAPPRK